MAEHSIRVRLGVLNSQANVAISFTRLLEEYADIAHQLLQENEELKRHLNADQAIHSAVEAALTSSQAPGQTGGTRSGQ